MGEDEAVHDADCAKAEGEYEVYRTRQDMEYISDFDREIKRIEGPKS